jgi:hypothetical protein
MEKIKRYRAVQTVSFEDFFNMVTDKGICEFCDSYNDCVEAMGTENIEAISGNGCSAFDTSVENIKKAYLLQKCATIGT